MIACLVTSAGCGEPPVAQPQPPSVSAFAISYVRSGGLKSMPQKLTIMPGRHASATVLTPRTGIRTVRFRVGAKRIVSLRKGLSEAHFSQLRTSNPGNCADCFLYSLRYRGHDVTLTEVDVPSPLRAVIDQLEALIAAHRPLH